ncbi:Fe-S cluster assembly protein NifU [Synechocystis sp. LKSZ1]|uniref:Fe-S cluster assembly protein NifU n=1 Tax=Synechocystis sp. LKSZ1 TaxID=3144951 RepID=UPI00336BDC78
MWNYSQKVLDLFYNPVNQGAITDEQEPDVAVVFGEVGSIACGDALRLHLKIQVSTEAILDAKFQTFGCTSAIASSSALTEIVKGKTLDEALQVSNHDIANYLGGLPEAKMHCSVMGQEALEAAIFRYRGIKVEDHEEDEGNLVCSCYAVTEPRIRRIIIENNLTTLEQVTNYLKAGGGCGTCLAAVEDILQEIQQQQAAVPTRLAAELATVDMTTAALPMTTLQKISLIQQVLDQEIRPVLRADGGDVELFDINGDHVQVVLKGACHGCSSSTATVKYAIEAQLRQRGLPTLTVEEVTV